MKLVTGNMSNITSSGEAHLANQKAESDPLQPYTPQEATAKAGDTAVAVRDVRKVKSLDECVREYSTEEIAKHFVGVLSVERLIKIYLITLYLTFTELVLEKICFLIGF